MYRILKDKSCNDETESCGKRPSTIAEHLSSSSSAVGSWHVGMTDHRPGPAAYISDLRLSWRVRVANPASLQVLHVCLLGSLRLYNTRSRATCLIEPSLRAPRALDLRSPLGCRQHQPNMASTLQRTTLRLPFRALHFAKPVWAPVRGTLLPGYYTDKLQVSTQWSARRQYASGYGADYMLYDGVHPDILNLYRARGKARGKAQKNVHSSRLSLSPPTNLMAFGALTDSGQATIEDALYLLVSTRSELHRLPEDLRRALCEDLQIGSCVLAWIRDLETFTSHSRAELLTMKFLTWHLVAEGNEPLAHDWVDETTGKHYSGGTQTKTLFTLPSGLVTAHLRQSESGSADAALTCYLALRRKCSHVPGDLFDFVAASTPLRIWLQWKLTPPCNAELYDRFVEDQLTATDGDVKQGAELSLWHPSRPNPWPFYDFALDMIDGRRQKPPSNSVWNSMGENAHRASYIMRLLGHQDEADSFQSKVFDNFAAQSKHREAIIAEFRADPKLAFLHYSVQGSTVDAQASHQVPKAQFNVREFFEMRAKNMSPRRG